MIYDLFMTPYTKFGTNPSTRLLGKLVKYNKNIFNFILFSSTRVQVRAIAQKT